MCGIVGVIKKSPTNQIIDDVIRSISGLKERGYDNSGIAIQLPGSPVLNFRAEGDPSNLKAKINGTAKLYTAQTGIGHSRWASVGTMEERNAHPHHNADRSIWVAHNGNVFNYEELWEFLEAEARKNPDFKIEKYSETDSEVIPNLLGYYYLQTQDFLQSLELTCKDIQGQYSIVAFHRDIPNEIFGAINASPLEICITDEEYALVSNVQAYQRYHLERIEKYPIPFGNMVHLTADGYDIYDMQSGKRDTSAHKFEEILVESLECSKGDHPHYMIKEILEQPEALERTIGERLFKEKPCIRLGGPELVLDRLKRINRINIVSTGSSKFAADIGAAYFRELCGLDAQAYISADFEESMPLITENTLVLAISQSGETKDTIDALAYADLFNCLTLGIVNAYGSRIPILVNQGIFTNSLTEKGVAATKTFTGQILAQLMLAIYIGKYTGYLKTPAVGELVEEILELPNLVRRTLECREQVKALASRFARIEKTIFFGKGSYKYIAQEGALKLTEINLKVSLGLSSGDAKHGYISLSDENALAMALIPNDSSFEQSYNAVKQWYGKHSNVVAITTDDYPKKLHDCTHEIVSVPKTNHLLQPILVVIVLQLFAYSCVENGLDPDNPRNLSKAITVN